MSQSIAYDLIVIISAFLGGIAIMAIIMAVFMHRRMLLVQSAQNELKFQSESLSWDDFLGEWGAIHTQLQALLAETPVDRFLILRAYNGQADPRWTTAVFQFREGQQQPVNYTNFELDPDYVARLGKIRLGEELYFDTIDCPDSAIKNVYLAEGVKSAAWYILAESTMPGNPHARAITYCSFGTHSEAGIPKNVRTRCQLLVSFLKSYYRKQSNVIPS